MSSPAPDAAPDASAVTGLSAAEVEGRVERGEVNAQAQSPNRTVGHIVRANVFTRFNALLGGLLAVIIIVGPVQDALVRIGLGAKPANRIIQELPGQRHARPPAPLNAPPARGL